MLLSLYPWMLWVTQQQNLGAPLSWEPRGTADCGHLVLVSALHAHFSIVSFIVEGLAVTLLCVGPELQLMVQYPMLLTALEVGCFLEWTSSHEIQHLMSRTSLVMAPRIVRKWQVPEQLELRVLVCYIRLL